MEMSVYDFRTSDACREIVERTGCSYILAWEMFKEGVALDFLYPVEYAVISVRYWQETKEMRIEKSQQAGRMGWYEDEA